MCRRACVWAVNPSQQCAVCRCAIIYIWHIYIDNVVAGPACAAPHEAPTCCGDGGHSHTIAMPQVQVHHSAPGPECMQQHHRTAPRWCAGAPRREQGGGLARPRETSPATQVTAPSQQQQHRLSYIPGAGKPQRPRFAASGTARHGGGCGVCSLDGGTFGTVDQPSLDAPTSHRSRVATCGWT